MFLMALGNAYQYRIVVHECTETNTWTNDLRKTKTQHEKAFYFAKAELSHLDLVVDSKKIRNTDSEIKITKVVSAGEPNNNNPTEINTKQEDLSEIQITKVIPANEQNNNSPTEIDIKEENILENYTSNTRTLGETKSDVSRRAVVRFISVNITGKKKTECLQTICHMIFTINVCMSYQ